MNRASERLCLPPSANQNIPKVTRDLSIIADKFRDVLEESARIIDEVSPGSLQIALEGIQANLEDAMNKLRADMARNSSGGSSKLDLS
jgi:hypothetical protein